VSIINLQNFKLQTEKKAEEKQIKKEVLPSFISKEIVVDDLFSLRHTLNGKKIAHIFK
jgi:hypothetical protein